MRKPDDAAPTPPDGAEPGTSSHPDQPVDAETRDEPAEAPSESQAPEPTGEPTPAATVALPPAPGYASNASGIRPSTPPPPGPAGHPHPGYPPYGYGYYYPRPTNGLAIASLVVSCCSIFMACLLYGIPGILGAVGAILGHVAQHQMKQSGEQGGGLALAGIIIGWVMTAIAILATLAIIVLVWLAIMNAPPEPSNY